MWMRACYIAKRSAGEMICQSSVYIVAGKNSIFIFLFYHPTEIIRKKLPIGNLNKSQNALFICVSTGITYRIHQNTNLSEWNTRGLQKCFLLSDFFFFKHIFHSYHFVFTQVIYVLILKCAWWPSIFKCSKTKTSGRE